MATRDKEVVPIIVESRVGHPHAILQAFGTSLGARMYPPAAGVWVTSLPVTCLRVLPVWAISLSVISLRVLSLRAARDLSARAAGDPAGTMLKARPGPPGTSPARNLVLREPPTQPSLTETR